MSKKQIETLSKIFKSKINSTNVWDTEKVIEIFEACILESEREAKKKQSDNLFPKMMEAYNDFCIKKIGAKAKIGPSEGKAMKTIISYLKSTVKNKTNSDDDVLNAWEYILVNVDKWDNFHQSQLKIVQIDSNLPNILNAIRNGNRQQQVTKPKSISEQTNDILNSPEFQRRRNSGGVDASKHLPT